jgi:hypothetical protein
MTIRSQGKNTLRNPLIAPPIALPEAPRSKLGPGWRRPASQLSPRDQFAGAQIEPLPNAQAQSARSNAASLSPVRVNRSTGTNSRTIDRDALIAQQDSDSNYGEFQ